MAGTALKAEAFLKEDIPATVLHTLCLQAFGTDIYEWEPETLWMEIQDNYKIDTAETNKDKLQAIISAVEIDSFYEDPQVFECIVKALNGQDPDFETVTLPTAEETAWGVAEVIINDNTPGEFSKDVQIYVREMLRNYGFLTSPELLKFSDLEVHYPIHFFEVPEYKESIAREQKVKHGRVDLYIAERKEALAKYMKQYA